MLSLIAAPGAFFITSFISLFIIIDPPGNVFPYLALVAEYPRPVAREVAWRACIFAFLLLTLVAVAGRTIIHFLGITLPAFQIAGGLVLLRIGFDMMENRGPFNRLDTRSSLAPEDYRDIALVPLAVPILSGPGAISTILVLASRSRSFLEDGLLLLALLIVMLLTFLAFRFGEKLLGIMRESGLRLFTRLMGLILVALAVEFVIQGLRAAFPALR